MLTTVNRPTLNTLLDAMTTKGELYVPLDEQKVRCVACAHHCLIGDGKRGICRVRFNRAGTLQVPFGYVVGLNPDPIEKKPFFHLLPGAGAMTFGMLGCNFHCSFCQNWETSQALKDDEAGARPTPVTAEQVVAAAVRYGCRLVVSSYNEPLITSEWAIAIFKLARAAGLKTAYVSNGNASPEVLDYLRPWTDAYKVDLKTMNDRYYRKLGGVRDNVLATIRRLYAMGFWVEIVTLVIPGFNDADAELKEIAGFIASVSPDIPWHVTAFHRDYKMTGPTQRNTSASDLLRAAEAGRAAGLHYVYAGNLPGRVGHLEDTLCPTCGTVLVERSGYWIQRDRLAGSGHCPQCHTRIPGIWN